MNDFVQQCRKEWKRLRVPDPVADEMAADLAADLDEAAADGVSAAEILGSNARDPRSFAASWAAERAVIPPPRLKVPRTLVTLVAIAALTFTVAGAVLVVFASRSTPMAARVPPRVQSLGGSASPIFVALPPSGVLMEDAARIVRFAPGDGSEVEANPVGSILLGVGLVGIIASLLFLLRPRPSSTGLA